jgi:predicted O-methyltransferase YrrM
MLAGLVPPDAAVLEFGSGNSTIWFATRFRVVYSVEHDPQWHGFVSDALRVHGLDNVRYFLHDSTSYARFEESANRLFDLIMIDGLDRAGCAVTALRRIKRGGTIYLDNSDKHPFGGDTRLAEERLAAGAKERTGQVLYFTDFAPGNLFCEQGMMVLLDQGPERIRRR